MRRLQGRRLQSHKGIIIPLSVGRHARVVWIVVSHWCGSGIKKEETVAPEPGQAKKRPERATCGEGPPAGFRRSRNWKQKLVSGESGQHSSLSVKGCRRIPVRSVAVSGRPCDGSQSIGLVHIVVVFRRGDFGGGW